MAIGPFITKGIGGGATIPHLILRGLSPVVPVDLTGGSTGYIYNPNTATATAYTYS